MGTLEKLQRSILGYLRSINDLHFAEIFGEDCEDLSKGGTAEGLKIEVCSPMPIKASKYAAGPTFSEVEICIEITRNNAIATRAPSLLTSAEIISRALHNWAPPTESGYGKILLAQSSPWKIERKPKVFLVKFNAQSVLQ